MALLRRRNNGNGNGDGTTLFFATDVHGSEVCFKKFVSAAAFYGADLLVLGGDLTGKLVVPIVPAGEDRYVAELHGERVTLAGAQLERFQMGAEDEGLYPIHLSPEEHAHYDEHPEEVEELFVRLMCERLAGWIEYAHDRLDGTEIKI
ncbi:MAG TPA: hypothetical protein VGI87_14025, partial [Solirubrobacteraceae bacterium]